MKGSEREREEKKWCETQLEKDLFICCHGQRHKDVNNIKSEGSETKKRNRKTHTHTQRDRDKEG